MAVTPDLMRNILARCGDWRSQKNNQRCAAYPPGPVVGDMLADLSPPLPELRRIVECPFVRPDGSLCTQPGYDPQTQVFYAAGPGFSVSAVPTRPTADEMTNAIELLVTPIAEFPFVSDADRAHTIALALLPYVRDTIDGPTPLHLISKPDIGTGATLLLEAIMYPALGRSPSLMSEARQEDEFRKRLTAKLFESDPVIVIDNLSGRLDSPALAVATTGNTWTDRLLGHSRTIDVPVTAIWIATGNNPAFSRELSRRILPIRLDAKMTEPWRRTSESFQIPDLWTWVRDHRGVLVHAALTIIRGWLAAGRPPGLRTIGSFEAYCRTLGGILDVAGVPGFLGNLDELYQNADPDAVAMEQFIEAWAAEFAENIVGVAALFPFAHATLDLGSGTQRSQEVVLGRKLERIRDRQFGEWRIVNVGKRQRANQWRLQRVVVNE